MNKCISMSKINPCICNNSSCDDINNGSCCSVGIRPYYCSDLCNQCGIYNSGCCCPFPPISSTGPMPPLPPLPPIPPIPPGIRSLGEFNAPRRRINDGDPFIFNNINIQGDAIVHVDGTSDIILAPNTLYEYSWQNIARVLGALDSDIGAKLVLNGVDIPGSESTVRTEEGVDRMIQNNGMFMTGNMQGVLRLIFVNRNDPAESESNLTIIAV